MRTRPRLRAVPRCVTFTGLGWWRRPLYELSAVPPDEIRKKDE